MPHHNTAPRPQRNWLTWAQDRLFGSEQALRHFADSPAAPASDPGKRRWQAKRLRMLEIDVGLWQGRVMEALGEVTTDATL